MMNPMARPGFPGEQTKIYTSHGQRCQMRRRRCAITVVLGCHQDAGMRVRRSRRACSLRAVTVVVWSQRMYGGLQDGKACFVLARVLSHCYPLLCVFLRLQVALCQAWDHAPACLVCPA